MHTKLKDDGEKKSLGICRNEGFGAYVPSPRIITVQTVKIYPEF